MNVSNALASVAVTDLADVIEWYERLLGPARHPMPELLEWQFPGGGGLQVYVGAERSGQCSCTLVVDDVEDVARHLRDTDLVADPQPQHHDTVDTLMIKDPAGNSIAFAAAHTDAVIS